MISANSLRKERLFLEMVSVWSEEKGAVFGSEDNARLFFFLVGFFFVIGPFCLFVPVIRFFCHGFSPPSRFR